MRYAFLFSMAAVACFSNMSLAQAQTVSCLVLGEPTARVASSEGERSPVFLAKDCESLRLLSGKAQASWVARDGKPRLVPITSQGVEQIPTPGAEERSATVVLGELTSRRERQQPAYMRNFGGDRAQVVFIPESGLMLVKQLDADAVITITAQGEQTDGNFQRIEIQSGQPVVLNRSLLKPDHQYTIQIQRGDLMEEWKWRMVHADEMSSIDSHLAEIDDEIADPYQRGLLKAMFFEQKRLRTNMDFLVRELR